MGGIDDAGDARERRRFEQLVGRTLGKYTLETLIGVGGMAAVYRARHRNGNRVALKLLHAELSVSTDVRERFLREGYVANSVEHPGVVRVLDDDVTTDGVPFLVMELLEGRTLEAHLQREGILAPAELVPLIQRLLEVLTTAHGRGVIHRDIKPENLFVQSDGSLKVLDFGIAKLAASALVSRTQTGRIMGTPAYMAPEQACGLVRLVDGQTDVWAVGAVLFRGLTGRHVYDAETPELMLIAAGTQAPEPVARLSPWLSPAVAAIVDSALKPTKGERWASASAMLDAVRSLPSTSLAPERASIAPGRRSESSPPTARSPSHESPTTPMAAVAFDRAHTRIAGPVIDSTTTSGVESGSSSARSRASWLPRALGPAVGVGLVVTVVLVAATAFVLKNVSTTSAPPAAEPPTVPGAPVTLTSAAVPRVVAESSSPIDRTVRAGATRTLASLPSTAEGAARSRRAASTKPPPPPETSEAPASPTSASSPPPDPCNPKYVVDADGNRHFKRECF